MKKILCLAFLSILMISSCKKKEADPIRTVVGTWKAVKYTNIVSNCGNGSNPGGSFTEKAEGQLFSDILVINAGGSGQLTSNNEVLATFKWSFTELDADRKLTFSDYKIVKANSADIILNTFINHQYVVNTYASDAIGFYSLTYPSSSNPCFTDTKIYDFKRISY